MIEDLHNEKYFKIIMISFACHTKEKTEINSLLCCQTLADSSSIGKLLQRCT